MIKTIVTTTINKPTEALIKFSKMKDWNLVVVGDKKTPHKFYEQNKDIIYLSPSDQEKISKRLSNLIGWNCIQRRNFGFIYAHKMRSDVVATVDDDNIPYKNWGKNLMVKKKIKARVFKANNNVFDPLSVTEHKKQIYLIDSQICDPQIQNVHLLINRKAPKQGHYNILLQFLRFH